MNGANTNDTLQATDTKTAPLFAAHGDFIFLNAKLFQRFKYLQDHHAELNLNPEQTKLLDVYYKQFVHAGAELPPAKQAELKIINKRLSTLQSAFGQKLLAAAKAGGLHFTDPSALAGLSEQQLAAAQEAAKARKMTGYVLPLQNTTQQPALDSLTSHDTRQKLFEASLNRAEHGDANDTRAIVSELAQLRAKKAALFGVANFADYNLYDQMAKDRATAIGFLDRVAPAVSAKEHQEWSDIVGLAKSQGANFQPTAADWNFYAEQIRKQRYALSADDAEAIFRVQQGADRRGLLCRQPALWADLHRAEGHPDVEPRHARVPGQRPGRQGAGDFHDRPVEARQQVGRRVDVEPRQPIVSARHQAGHFQRRRILTKPAPGQPALISFDDVTTMFHEFGHALHGMFAAQTYPTLSGTSVARDFVEFPSQFNENWALDPKILPHYAVHYQTGQAIPQALVQKILAARTFNQGYAVGEALEAARLDLDWHSLPGTALRQDVDKFEADALAEERVRHRRRAAALSFELFPAHLEQRLFGELLRLCRGRGCSARTRSTGSRRTAA